jgi:PAS domain S-box-containing protein
LAERKRAEQALQASEQTLRALLNATVDVEFLIDTQGFFLALNETLARDLGKSADELRGSYAYSLLPPALAETRRAQIEQVIQSGQASRFEDQSSSAWYDNSIVPIFDEAGRVVKLAVFARNITERKQAEADLRHRDAILEAVAFAAWQFLQTANWQMSIQTVLAQLGRGTGASHVYIFVNQMTPAGVLVTSQRFEWVAPGLPSEIDNPIFQNIAIWESDTGRWAETLYRGEPFYGNLSTLLPGEVNQLLLYGVKSLLDMPIVVDEAWWGIIGFDDCLTERIWSVAEVDALKVVASTLSAAIQRQRADEQIRLLNTDLERRVVERTAALEAAYKDLESFSYSVSHDLRAPLRSIDGFSQALLEDYQDKLDSDGQRYLEIVRRETQRMGHLIDDLLSLAQITRQNIRHVEVDLSQLATELIALFQQREPQRQVEVIIQPGLTVTGDVNLIRIMLDNLLSNAWKYTDKRPSARIELGAQRHGNQIEYFVRDNGAGFDMAYAHKLFGVFQRLHSMNEFEGTGIGLATVKRISQRHGGRVWAEAAVNQGATFYFTLPNSSPAP